jgi:hypothetical protein
MAKVLTIRDPKTGNLIAKEWLRSEEDTETAVARVFRKFLGRKAPEQMVITKSIFLRDQKRAEEHAGDWDRYSLMIIGPRGDANLEKSHFVMTAIEPELEFARAKSDIDAIKHGRMRDTAIPGSPNDPPIKGSRVRFVQARYDPFGDFLIVPDGDSVLVELTEVRDSGEEWGSDHIYDIAWDPTQVKKMLKTGAAQGSK